MKSRRSSYFIEDVGEQQPPGFGRHLAEVRGIGHRDAEAEGDAEVGLRNGEEALGEGIAGGEEERRHRQPDDQRFAEAAPGRRRSERAANSASASRVVTLPAVSGRSLVRSTCLSKSRSA
jgi:hypothetical protein